MKLGTRFTLLVGFFLAMAMSAVGCGSGDLAKDKTAKEGPDSSIRKKEPQAKKVTPPDDKQVKKTPAKAEFTLTSKEFAAEETKDKEAFKKKYAGKVVELSGIVVELGRLYEGDTLNLEGDDKFRSVDCVTTAKEPWKTVLPGQTVKVVGTYETGIIGKLRDCVILEKSGNGPNTVTADQLAKELKANFSSTEEKYRVKKNLILTGEVTKIIDRNFALLVVLKTADPEPVVFAQFNDWSKDIVAEIKVGERLIAVGNFITFDPYFADRKQPHAGIYAGGTLDKLP